MTDSWQDEDRVEWYLSRIGRLEPRLDGEAALVELLPPTPRRILDLGCGDGRLLAAVLAARPSVEQAVALDVSEPMLVAARDRFVDDARVRVGVHDLREELPADEPFDVVVSGFAIHHLEDDRKAELYREAAELVAPGGLFANLEVVSSATPEEHRRFLDLIGRPEDDPDDRLAALEDQLGWLADAGLVEVACAWRWMSMALLVGRGAA